MNFTLPLELTLAEPLNTVWPATLALKSKEADTLPLLLAEKVSVPLIDECPIALECRVSHQLTLGIHDLFIGEIVAVQVDETILTPQGQIDWAEAQLLAYAGGHYWQLGEQLGRFGDWRQAFK